MKKKMLTLLIIIIVVFSFQSFMILAQSEGEQGAQPEQPQQPADQYQDFAKNPDPQDFGKLSPEDQAKYISQISDYGSGDLGVKNKAIARDYFSSSPDNINSNTDSFKKYLGAEGVDIKDISGAQGISLSKQGVLTGKGDQVVNIAQFKEGQALAGFDVSIKDGEIILHNKGSGQETKFTGTLLNDGTGKIRLTDGTINGMLITGGSGIEIRDDNSVSGTFKNFGGIEFKDLTTVDYDAKNKVVSLDGAEIIGYDNTAAQAKYLKGSMKVDNYESMPPGFFVRSGDSLKVNEFTVTASYAKDSTQNRDVALIFGGDTFTQSIEKKVGWGGMQNDNFVRFNSDNGGTVEASGVAQVKYQAVSIPIDAKVFSPEKGYFGVGDRSTQGTDDYSKITAIQRIVGFTGKDLDGNYGATTEQKVKQWQVDNNLEPTGQFGEKEMSKYLQDLSSVTMRSEGGRAVYSANNGVQNFDVYGNARVLSGNTEIKSDGTNLFKPVDPVLLEGQKAPIGTAQIKVSLYDQSGNVIGNAEQKSGQAAWKDMASSTLNSIWDSLPSLMSSAYASEDKTSGFNNKDAADSLQENAAKLKDLAPQPGSKDLGDIISLNAVKDVQSNQDQLAATGIAKYYGSFADSDFNRIMSDKGWSTNTAQGMANGVTYYYLTKYGYTDEQAMQEIKDNNFKDMAQVATYLYPVAQTYEKSQFYNMMQQKGWDPSQEADMAKGILYKFTTDPNGKWKNTDQQAMDFINDPKQQPITSMSQVNKILNYDQNQAENEQAFLTKPPSPPTQTDVDKFYAKMTTEALDRKTFQPEDVPTPVRQDCVGYVINDLLKKSYEGAGRTDEYNRLKAVSDKNQARGSYIAQELQRQGWQTVFMAPDSVNPTAPNEYFSNTGQKDPDYAGTVTKAETKGTYGVLNLKVDAVVTDYYPTTEQMNTKQQTVDSNGVTHTEYIYKPVPQEKVTPEDTTQLDMLESNPTVKAGLVVARDGFHTAELVRDSDGTLKVAEAHWDKGPDSPSTIALTPLKNWDWGSYIVVLPKTADLSGLKKPATVKS